MNYLDKKMKYLLIPSLCLHGSNIIKYKQKYKFILKTDLIISFKESYIKNVCECKLCIPDKINNYLFFQLFNSKLPNELLTLISNYAFLFNQINRCLNNDKCSCITCIRHNCKNCEEYEEHDEEYDNYDYISDNNYYSEDDYCNDYDSDW